MIFVDPRVKVDVSSW